MTIYDLHSYKVNLVMVSAHYVLKSLYETFGADVLRTAIDSFEAREKSSNLVPPHGYKKPKQNSTMMT